MKPNPDTRQYYKIERVALWKAGIDPDTCGGSIKKARKKNIEGWEKAKAYLKQLKNLYYEGNNLMIMDKDFEILIDSELAEAWQPEKEQITPVGSKKHSETRLAPSVLNALGLFLEELKTEGEIHIFDKKRNKINPPDITQTDIVNNFHRLAKKYNQTLKSLSPATMQRVIKKALNSLDKHYDDPPPP